MQFTYWEQKADKEHENIESTIVEQRNQPENIVNLDEVRQIKQEEKEFEQKEIDEFFAEENKKQKRGRVAKYIFVDGLLGITFLTVCDLLISAFIALFFVIALVFLAGFIVTFAGSVLALCFGIMILPGRVPTGLATIAGAVLLMAISLVFLLLSAAFGLKIMTWTAKLPGKLENKLHLFRREA